MKLVALLAAGFVTASAPALAQYAPRPMVPIGPMPPEGVFEMVRQMGLEPLGPAAPERTGLGAARGRLLRQAAARGGRCGARAGRLGRADRRTADASWRALRVGRRAVLAQAVSLWRHDAGRRLRAARLDDGAARATTAIGLAAGRPAETRGEIRRHYAGTSAGAAQAAVERAAGGSRLGRAAASRAAACAGSRAAEARCRVAGCIRRNPRTLCRRSRRWNSAQTKSAPFPGRSDVVDEAKRQAALASRTYRGNACLAEVGSSPLGDGGWFSKIKRSSIADSRVDVERMIF